jgi:transcription-repair coupling factor (superfamily II helicase)
MDRLICGDVGYGKTEVAMRAAFKAVNDGKQVALLAPTTVLAFQHFNTFSERFRGFPVSIAMLSRFLNRDEQRDVLKRAAAGTVDILIGTHRILSKDVHFRDLGLIIVDEEQRFGVAQKEKLKRFKSQVDVLTLSATPIPRTLNMSLIGIRDLSIIETPPRNRLAIQTAVAKFSRQTIRSAIDLELKRSGQAFFVHNSVETIYSAAEMVQSIVPEARVAVAHGQMKEHQLEQVMLDFLRFRYDVLVCTTIIENGLDIPRANTIVVNRADHFGLSQLYQLRGRVGRSDRRAYAYLLIPAEEMLSPTARKRLVAIREFSELGSGFRLAAMDLEIRGAGNLLGGEQHGHIRTVGYELYVKLLEQTIRELKGESIPEEIRTNIDLRMDIQIPEHYVEDPNLRLWLYKRVSKAVDNKAIAEFREEMTDRFGKYPRSVTNLLEYARLRLRCRELKILSLERRAFDIVFKFREDTPLAAEKVVSMAQGRKDLTFSPEGDLILKTPTSDASDLFDHLHDFLDKMSYSHAN